MCFLWHLERHWCSSERTLSPQFLPPVCIGSHCPKGRPRQSFPSATRETHSPAGALQVPPSLPTPQRGVPNPQTLVARNDPSALSETVPPVGVSQVPSSCPLVRWAGAGKPLPLPPEKSRYIARAATMNPGVRTTERRRERPTPFQVISTAAPIRSQQPSTASAGCPEGRHTCGHRGQPRAASPRRVRSRGSGPWPDALRRPHCRRTFRC